MQLLDLVIVLLPTTIHNKVNNCRFLRLTTAVT